MTVRYSPEESDPTLGSTTRVSTPALLSTLWIFASLNYIYCDVVGLMNAEDLRAYLSGSVNGIDMTSGFLLGATALVEIPMLMVLLSRILPHRANRISNIAAGAIMTIVQAASLFVGSSTPAYAFSSVVEIATTAAVVWIAWHWDRPSAPAGG